MKDLVDWLRAQIDEDERVARKNTGNAGLGDDGSFPDYRTYDGADLDAADEFLRHFTSQRELREVEAKRRQIDWCVEVLGDRDLSRYGEPGALKDDRDALAVTLAVETLKLLALPCSDRAGYLDKWRP